MHWRDCRRPYHPRNRKWLDFHDSRADSISKLLRDLGDEKIRVPVAIVYGRKVGLGNCTAWALIMPDVLTPFWGLDTEFVLFAPLKSFALRIDCVGNTDVCFEWWATILSVCPSLTSGCCHLPVLLARYSLHNTLLVCFQRLFCYGLNRNRRKSGARLKLEACHGQHVLDNGSHATDSLGLAK